MATPPAPVSRKRTLRKIGSAATEIACVLLYSVAVVVCCPYIVCRTCFGGHNHHGCGCGTMRMMRQRRENAVPSLIITPASCVVLPGPTLTDAGKPDRATTVRHNNSNRIFQLHERKLYSGNMATVDRDFFELVDEPVLVGRLPMEAWKPLLRMLKDVKKVVDGMDLPGARVDERNEKKQKKGKKRVTTSTEWLRLCRERIEGGSFKDIEPKSGVWFEIWATNIASGLRGDAPAIAPMWLEGTKTSYCDRGSCIWSTRNFLPVGFWPVDGWVSEGKHVVDVFEGDWQDDYIDGDAEPWRCDDEWYQEYLPRWRRSMDSAKGLEPVDEEI